MFANPLKLATTILQFAMLMQTVFQIQTRLQFVNVVQTLLAMVIPVKVINSNKKEPNNQFICQFYKLVEIPRYDGNFLLMSQGMSIIKVPLDSGNPKAKPGYPVIVLPKQMATGIDIDCLRGKVSLE
jgi:hypothetical protein